MSHELLWQVLNQLPEKVEKVEYCSLIPEQLQLYQREVELGRKEMKNGGGEEGRGVGKEISSQKVHYANVCVCR